MIKENDFVMSAAWMPKPNERKQVLNIIEQEMNSSFHVLCFTDGTSGFAKNYIKCL